jgi:acetylglutamate/LysW-gamma-L-alpha-aminoadipate kinase
MLVIKIGGGAAIGEGGFQNFAVDLAGLGEPFVVVHGGNAEFSDLSRRLGMPPRMVTSQSGRVSRYTDAATMDAMLMAYCGKVNKRSSRTLRRHGVNAVGLSAIDGGIGAGRRQAGPPRTEEGQGRRCCRDDHAGTLETGRSDAGPAAARQRIPAGADAARRSARRGADQRRRRQAGAGAGGRPRRRTGLLFFSDTPGLLADRHDEASLIRRSTRRTPAPALAAAGGRMVVKVEAALGAVARGVGRVVFADGRAEAPVSRAMAGAGTVVRAPTSVVASGSGSDG